MFEIYLFIFFLYACVFQADVLVNSTDCRLEHTHAAVSGLILQTVGTQLQELCHSLYPSGIEDRILAVTPSGIDQWKEIYHIVLPQTFWEDQVGSEEREVLLSVL